MLPLTLVFTSGAAVGLPAGFLLRRLEESVMKTKAQIELRYQQAAATDENEEGPNCRNDGYTWNCKPNPPARATRH